MATIAQADGDDDFEDRNVTNISEAQFSNLLKLISAHQTKEPSIAANVPGTCLITCSNSKWIIDSGATYQICTDLTLFNSHTPFIRVPNTITIAYGKQVIVEHIGTVDFGNGITLENVLHVPRFKFNLLSTHKLCKDMNCEVTFTPELCLLQDPLVHHSLVLGKLPSGLYVVCEHINNKTYILDSTTESAHLAHSTNDVKLWHLRLGHIPFNKLHLVHPSLLNKEVCDYICQICPKARQTRLPFHACSTITTNYFELVHVDTWGPYESKTYDEYSWFLTVVDDFSRNTWTFLMKNKTDVVSILNVFYNMVQTQYKTCIQCLRTDNAKDFCEGDILELFYSKGIKHQETCTDNPQ